VRRQRRLRRIVMADVVFRRVLGATLVPRGKQIGFECRGVVNFRNDVIVVEDVT
jgi:hypothetical protein